MNVTMAPVTEAQAPPFTIKPVAHIGFLDGMRGALCVWVLIYHSAVMSGFNSRFIPGALVVDGFMLISGFVMAYMFSAKKSELSPNVIMAFYTRRIFRVVPVYYLTLFVVVIFYTQFALFINEGNAAFPPPWAADLSNDPSVKTMDFQNIILHMTFLFGLNPHYASNLPIPDWTLALEMQFYAVVPFLIMAFRKYGLIVPVLLLALINFLASRYIGLYLIPKAWGLWPQPSLLAFKIDCFMIGMLLTFYFLNNQFNRVEILVLLLLLLTIQSNIILSATVAASFAILHNQSRHRLFDHGTDCIARIFQSKIMRFFGTISYDFYLIHPLVLLTVMHFLLKSQWYIGNPAFVRFLLLVSGTMAIVVPLSYLLHRLLERPCQNAAGPFYEWALARKRAFGNPSSDQHRDAAT